MIIQLAIDRVTVEEAIKIIEETKEYIDIVEVGTSLIKDYGMSSVRKIKETFPNTTILADIKTIDEAEYEFRAVYEAGADIATVMGASALDTIEICDRIAKEYKKDYMIDLLEVDEYRLPKLTKFPDAIFGVHLPADKAGVGLDNLINESVVSLKSVKRIAVAGGVSIRIMPFLEKCGIEIVIVGGAITKALDRTKAAKDFRGYKE